MTVEEKQKLEGWARRPKSAQRLALRARIVLKCATGTLNQDVADVTVQNPVHFIPRDGNVQRLVLAAPWPKPYEKPRKCSS
jgi:hypothetical protein